jgi:hypothetical protein
MRTDRQTHMTKLMVAFRNFANTAKNEEKLKRFLRILSMGIPNRTPKTVLLLIISASCHDLFKYTCLFFIRLNLVLYTESLHMTNITSYRHFAERVGEQSSGQC